MDAKTETMTESPVYYTTAYEIRIVKNLCAFVTANGIILLSFTLNRIQAVGLGVIHGYIMGMILSYLVFGTTCKRRNRRIITALDWWFEPGLVLLFTTYVGGRSLVPPPGQGEG